MLDSDGHLVYTWQPGRTSSGRTANTEFVLLDGYPTHSITQFSWSRNN